MLDKKERALLSLILNDTYIKEKNLLKGVLSNMQTDSSQAISYSLTDVTDALRRLSLPSDEATTSTTPQTDIQQRIAMILHSLFGFPETDSKGSTTTSSISIPKQISQSFALIPSIKKKLSLPQPDHLLAAYGKQIESLFRTFISLSPKPKSLEDTIRCIHVHLNGLKKRSESWWTRRTLPKSLFSQSTGLYSIPRDLSQCSFLRILNLSDNAIAAIPPWIKTLSNLTELYLPNNQISHIAKEIGALKKLTFCDLRNNILTQVPQELLYLSCFLDLSNNQLITLPDQASRTLALVIDNNSFSLETKAQIHRRFSKQLQNAQEDSSDEEDFYTALGASGGNLRKWAKQHPKRQYS